MAEQQLPKWEAVGVEPPTVLKTEGWQPGMKPSAQHMNWLFHRIYKCLEEIQAGGETEELKQELAALQAQVNALNQELDSAGAAIQSQITAVNNKVNEHQADYTQLKGDLSTLKTAAKDSIPNIVNELFTNVSDGKSLVGGAITDVDPNVIIPAEPSFLDLATAIGGISTGKKWASGTLRPGSMIKYTNTANSDQYAYPVTVSGLNFKPSRIYIHYPDNGIISSYYRPEANVIDAQGWGTPIKLQSPAFINETGFSIPASGSATVLWIAYE